MADKEKKLSKPARPAGGKITDLVEEVSELSVLELSELVGALQEKLGVSPQTVAAAPVAGQAAAPSESRAPGEAAPSDGGGIQTVVLTETGANKIAVIKALREINRNLTLMDAKTMTETVPAEVLKEAKTEDAKAASEKLKAAGATVELK